MTASAREHFGTRSCDRKARTGKHVLFDVGAIVSHEVVTADYATVSPRCVTGGGFAIAESAFFGIASTVRDQMEIGAAAVVAAAVVVANVEANQTVMGVRAHVGAASSA